MDLNISDDEFDSISNLRKEYDKTKEIPKLKDLIKFFEDLSLFIKQCYRIFEVQKKYRK